MKKNILILFLLIQVLVVSSQQWIPDVNKKFSFTSSWQLGSCLLSVKDTLFIGGQFARISNFNASCIVKYFNGNWYVLKGGLDSYPQALLYNYNDNNLYVSGTFLQADGKPGTRGLARWDGNNWWAIGSGVNCPGCYGTIEYYDNKVFFSGSNLPGPATGVVAWDGTNWVNKSSLPPIVLVKGYSNDLLAGHAFSGIFLKFEGGTTWSSQPYGGIYGGIERAERDTINNLLYIGGGFNWVNINNPIESKYIAKYDGFEWHSMGTTSAAAYSMKMYNGYFYVGFTSDTISDGTNLNWIGRWDGNQWQPLGAGLNQGATAMEEFHDTLFVTGVFTTAGGDSAYGLARWYMPDTNCAFLQPTIHTLALQDTFYLGAGLVNVQFFNNNAYAQTWQWNFGDLGTANTQNPTHTYTNDTAYTITVTVTEDGCTKTDTAKIWVLNSNDSEYYTQENLHFIIYPNPTDGDFTLECTLPQNKTGVVQAYRVNGSQLGKHLLESGCNNIVMPASKWNAANIILVGVFIDNKLVFVEKVVKQ